MYMKKLTTEEFIEKARLKHGDKYDYSKVDYQGSKVKVCIICPKHGEFWQRPNDILSGMGCPICGGTKKMTTEEFIEKAKIVHHNYFSYEKTVYKNSNEKVIVTCPLHGDFEVKANNHLNGVNCKVCQENGIKHMTTKLKLVNKSTKSYSTEEFINKCKQKYGDIYNYDKTIYVNNRTKVCITCLTHGDFWITPNHFLSGRGCSKCSRNYQYTKQEIIKQFCLVHGDKYDYSQSEYISTHKNLKIICPEHGEFWQSPANHLKGQGCPKCEQSKLEKEIMCLLNKHNIVFEYQKTFDWLKYARKLYLDFYLPDYNVAIECQGIQHFKPIGFGEKDEKKIYEMFESIKIRDNIKRELCNKHGISVYYYSDKIYNNDFLNIIDNKLILLKNIKENLSM